MVKKCVNNHYYDGGRFSQCPYCGAKDTPESSAPENETPKQAFSQPVQQSAPQPAPQPMQPAFSADDDDDATIPLAFYKRQSAPTPEPSQQKAPESVAVEPQPPKPAVNEAPAALDPADEDDDRTIPVSAVSSASFDESATDPVVQPQAETVPEQKPEEAPIVIEDIAALVADAIADDRQAEPDKTEQPTPEEVAAADAAMQQEPVTDEIGALASQAAEAQPAELDKTEQPTPEEVAAADEAMQQEQQVMGVQQPVYGQPMEMYQQAAYQPAPPFGGYPGGYGYQPPMPQPLPEQPQVMEQPAPEDKPTVGWLVGLNGRYYGRTFDLKAGRNFIGRAPDMDIMLDEDTSVSFTRHASVIYDPKARVFIAQAGESNGLIYVNGEMVLNSINLSPYDRITVGGTMLLFFPLCSETFAWEDLDSQG